LDSDSNDIDAKPKEDHREILIQSIENDNQSKPAKETAWLGLAVQESPEALSSQLGLKRGEGLTVNFLAADSPAVKAQFEKNDVLVEMDGQMLVHPLQFRKLVQMHEIGDTVKVSFYRGGKKREVSVKLGKASQAEASNGKLWQQGSDLFRNYQSQFDGLSGELSVMGENLSKLPQNQLNFNTDTHTMELTRKAIQNAVNRASMHRLTLTHDDNDLQDLARDGTDVDKDATIVVRNKHNSSRTVLQTDDTGTYIIESGAKTHLTARDQHGKLLFDGDIDTAAERKKVPKDVWERVEPMYEQSASSEAGPPKKNENKYRA
jgi:hypothetical protein